MSGSATPNQLPHAAPETPGKPPIDPTAPGEPDQTADALIREVMVAQKRRDSHAALPELEENEAAAQAKPIKHPRRLFRKSETPSADTATDAERTKSAGLFMRSLQRGVDAIRSYRPSRKHLIVAAVIAIMYFRPWLIPITLFVLFLSVLIAYLTLGPDRVAELVVGAWQKLRARRPELAETIRQRAELMATRIDAALDRVPGSWTDGLHVPDFSEADTAIGDRPDPFDRLAKEAQRG